MFNLKLTSRQLLRRQLLDSTSWLLLLLLLLLDAVLFMIRNSVE